MASVGKDASQLLHDLFFAEGLRDRELLHEEVAGGVEHLSFPERQLLVALEHEQVAEHLGDLENAAGLDLLGGLPVTVEPCSPRGVAASDQTSRAPGLVRRDSA